MKKGLKYIIGYALIGTYIVTMMSFVNIAYNKRHCSAIDIVVNDSISSRFVQAKDIRKIIKDKHFELISQRPTNIDLDSLERVINDHPSIKQCECYFLSNCALRIGIDQRHPIARVITAKYNFYIDEDGQEMPLSPFYTAHVPVINGHYKPKYLNDLYHIAKHLQQDTFWEAQIEQIVVMANGDYALIPRAGRHTIELGDANNLDRKLEGLMALYLQVFNNNAWNKYKTISLKYDGQIVCTKK